MYLSKRVLTPRFFVIVWITGLQWDKVVYIRILVGDSGINLNMMLIGEYEHTLDEKKRVSLPKAFAKALGKKMVMTRGLDTCLFLFAEGEWKNYKARIEKQADAMAEKLGEIGAL